MRFGGFSTRAKRLLAGLAVIGTGFAAAASHGQAAGETASSTLSMTPVSGKLFRDLAVPVNWQVGIEITAPYPASPKVAPMKEIHASLPRDMSFNPDPGMEVCPDSKIGPETDLSVPPESAIALCPDSVLGNGTAEHYIGGTNNPGGPTLRDAAVIIFNGGKTPGGLPRIKIYGYSAGAGAGIYMEGVLKNGHLRVSLPVLPFDSATGRFDLSIPGTTNSHADRRGLDPSYVRSTCSTGKWQAQVDFLLGPRDTLGNASGPESTVFAPPLTIACAGLPGKVRLSKLTVKGPAAVRSGSKVTYRVKIANSGTAAARGVEVAASGGAKGTVAAGVLAPKATRTAKMKVRFARPGIAKVKFRVKARGVKPRIVTKSVRVR